MELAREQDDRAKQAQLRQQEAEDEAAAAAAKEEEIAAIWSAQQRVQTEYEATLVASAALEEQLLSVQ